MLDRIAQIFQLKHKEVVLWDDLFNAPFAVWIDLFSNEKAKEDSKVKYLKIHSKAKGQMLFRTKIEKGSGYHYHSHDCKETITVLSGQVLVNDSTVYKENEQATFYAKTLHKVTANEDTELLVEFTKTRLK